MLIPYVLFIITGVVKSPKACPVSCTCYKDNKYDGTEVSCSGKSFSYIPQDVPVTVTIFKLDDNNIRRLKTLGMLQLTSLRELDLSQNRIDTIEKDAFRGLSQLEILHLDNNWLNFIDDQGYAVFDHLVNLKVLSVKSTGISVSGHQIPELVSLQALYVSYSDYSFSVAFSSLTSLSSLAYSKGTLRIITNSTFVHVPFLKSLSVKGCKINHIEPGSFTTLKKLEFLDLSYNWNLGLDGLIFFGLKNSPIRILDISYISILEGCIKPLDENTLRYLKETNIKEIKFDGNVFSYVAKNAWKYFPVSLESISIRYSIFGDFRPDNLTGIYMLKKLKSLDITGIMQWDPASENLHSTNLPPIIPLPSGLQEFKLSNRFLKTKVGVLTIHPPKLTLLDMSRNFITSLTGPVTGINNLKYVDFSSNVIYQISSFFLPKSNSLEYFNISNNDLGNCFETDSNGYIFARYDHMKVLDISSNRISSLPRNIFSGLRQMKYVNISSNEMFAFHVSLSHMTDLQHLDLSNNKLQLLPTDVQNDLDVLNQTVVNLKDNPLACSCQSLQFLEWLRKTHYRIQGLRNMACRLPTGNLASFKDINSIISRLNEQCSSRAVVVTASVAGIMCVLVGALGFLGYRHRWKLRYLYHVGRKGFHSADRYVENDYPYDAFVSYADEDRGFVINSMIPELEEKAGLKLCIHHRDFLPGAVITENIVSSIQDSRKTLIVLTPNFLKSGWCTYEFNMARVDGISRKQNTIVMVLYEKVLLKDVPKDLAVMLTNNSYLEYNATLYGGVVFWNNLVEALKITQRLH